VDVKARKQCASEGTCDHDGLHAINSKLPFNDMQGCYHTMHPQAETIHNGMRSAAQDQKDQQPTGFQTWQYITSFLFYHPCPCFPPCQ
jgi:hypothetical protein